MRNLEETQASNQYFINENMKACPFCGAGPIFRETGCDQMVCGKNAPDKRRDFGLTMYAGLDADAAGCGRDFNWEDARPYKASAQFNHSVPSSDVADVVVKNGLHSSGLKCVECKSMIRGTAFVSLHDDSTTICWTCVSNLLGGTPGPSLLELVQQNEITTEQAKTMAKKMEEDDTFRLVQPDVFSPPPSPSPPPPPSPSTHRQHHRSIHSWRHSPPPSPSSPPSTHRQHHRSPPAPPPSPYRQHPRRLHLYLRRLQ